MALVVYSPKTITVVTVLSAAVIVSFEKNFLGQFRLVISSVSPTWFLQSALDAKLKIDEFWYELWNSVKKIQCSLHKNKI